ncbi:purple acid phosphatase family protein [Sporomusa termitida]|uniref:Calcineurin-like phosphoeSPTERase n=1 Tax=Sporomusa termitida TaxID=2377 RepID=A0A517DR72_9FIRM|nr:metallophosphoesterase family protein [Sporomusa termitida]QDR79872.1 Calcineurin-like phosphoeSPTERase [Sporomusa termitida]
MFLKKSLPKLVFTTLLLAVLLVSGSSLARSNPTGPDCIALTWSGDPRTTQAITWQTPDPALDQVQYIIAGPGQGLPGAAKTATATKEYLPGQETAVHVFSACLTDLQPDTRYLYRLGNGTAWGDFHSFQTAADAVTRFTFLVFGDSQSDDLYTTWRQTLQLAYQAQPAAAFFTNVGDLVNTGTDFNEWQAWFAASQGVINRIPAMPLTGNHEMYTPRWKVNEPPALFTAQFQLPRNGPAGLTEQVYSFDYGNVHFVMLDSQEREEQLFNPDMLARQREWLDQDLARTDKPWKIVFLHRPPYHNDRIQAAFVPLFDKYQVDVVFSGHEHIYARTYPLYGGNRAPGPDRGTVYITAGRSGTKAHDRAAAGLWDEAFYNPLDQPNYLTVQVQDDTLTVKAWQQDGALIDQWQLAKAAPARLKMAQ